MTSMTGKIVKQFLVLLIAFFGSWFTLSQINFINQDDLDQFSKASERKLSELILDALQNGESEIESDSVKVLIDSIGRRICEANKIVYDSIKVHFMS